MNKIPEDLISLDTQFAKSIGFTSDKFSNDSYLWGFPDFNGIMISNISSNKKGSFREMIQAIEKLGISFRIPTPSNRMVEIGRKQGWGLGLDGEGCIFLTNEKRPLELLEEQDK